MISTQPNQPNQTNTMKFKAILLSIIALPFLAASCAPTEYHSVRVYEHHRTAPSHHTDEPRDFVPKEKF